MVAQEKGFYREAGLDVTHLNGGPGKNCFASLAAEETTFCTGWLSAAILQRGAGLRLVNLAQMIQRSSLLLVAKKSSGIREPKDIENKRVGFWVGDFDAPGLYFLKKHNLRVRVIPNYTTVTVFLAGAVDAVAAMWYNEYHTILNSGFNPDELSVLKFADTGVNFPEDGLYCSEEMFESDPALCLAFAEASLKGWKHAFDHPDETIEIVMRRARDANTGTNVAHQRWMLAAMKELMTPDGKDKVFGRLSEEDYRGVSEALKEVNLIREVPEYAKFYRGPR
jgi:NitT/TauT family transport system substrate-binding protein